LGVSERRACKVLAQPRSTQRYEVYVPDDEQRLREDIARLACKYGRYGYRRVTALLRRDGWRVNHKRVERIWRQEGLKVPKRQPKRGRLWLNDGSCVRLRPLRPNHVWSYDFVSGRTSDGLPLKFLTILDEYTREWLARVEVKTLFIEPGSPWENGYVESFNGKFRDEFLNRELLDTLLEARVLTARWRRRYNGERPHSSLGYRPPAPEAREGLPALSATLRSQAIPL
jgi:transposase InsO family protein